ncbi:hypothetical protein BV898_19372 [Hypsibius exemplaris]|uniref:Uncharacterized protein n=1 Tax=Hypsibius exemplaris TaxID=2072580 RepID=A0A9X6NJ47_HYPEX|nr:hypothetical protein BV898_19372 [Hypsibius exemplaris]
MFLLKLLLLICGVGIFVIFGLCTYLNGLGLESLMVKNDTCPRSDYRCSAAFPAGPHRPVHRVPRPGRRPYTGLAYDLWQPETNFNVLHLNTSKNAHVLSLADQMRFAQNIHPPGTRNTRPSSTPTWPGSTDAFGVPRLRSTSTMSADPIDRLVSYFYFCGTGRRTSPVSCRGGGRASCNR